MSATEPTPEAEQLATSLMKIPYPPTVKEAALRIDQLANDRAKRAGHAYECMIDGNCRRVFADCKAAGRCLAATQGEQATHTVSLDFDSREDAERVFDRLERLKWIASSGATLSLRSGDAARDPSDARFEQKLRDGLRTWKPNQYHASDMAFVLRLLNEARAQ